MSLSDVYDFGGIPDNRILLVKHVHPKTKYEWWVPPGGGLEDTDESIIDCVKRETYEETGIIIEIDENPVFIREFEDKENNVINIELFFKALSHKGHITKKYLKEEYEDFEYIKDIKWLDLNELDRIVVYPEELREDFGRKIGKIYLGRQSE